MMSSFRTMMVLTFASGLMLVAPGSAIAQTTAKDEIAAGNAAMAAKDIPTALRHLTAACDMGSTETCQMLGESAFNSGNAAAKALAAGLFEKSCSGGSAMGCNNLAQLYYFGSGVTKDAVRAEALHEKACAKGNVGSCGTAGYMLSLGDGVAENKAKAASLYEQGCIGGLGDACAAAGVLYANGAGVTTDEARALRLYDKGCDEKSAAACIKAGLLIHRQELVLHRDGLIGDIKTTTKQLCNKLTDLGCSGGTGSAGFENSQARTPEQTVAAKAKSLIYYKKAFAIDPNDDTTKKLIAEYSER